MSQDQKVHLKSEIKQAKFSRMKSPTLWIGVLALVILAIWAFGTASAYEALNEPTRGNSLSLNPELSAARRYAEVAASAWVANPELSAANRFAETSAAGLEEANLYQNPELKVVASQAVIMYGDYDGDFLATNPEIKTHQRFVEGIGK